MSSAASRSGVALVLCAPSGTGKTTLSKRLIAEFPRFAFSISCTTRAPRLGEIDGKDYTFLSVHDFHALREQGHFAEWAEVYGNFYGTPLAATTALLREGRDLLFDVDVQGAAQLKRSLPAAVLIFILPPSRAVLEARLIGRGSETEASLTRRMTNAREVVAQANWFDTWIINDNLEEAYADLRAVYQAAMLTPNRRPEFVNSLLREWA